LPSILLESLLEIVFEFVFDLTSFVTRRPDTTPPPGKTLQEQ
jgi:hypothetical protein